MEKAGIDLRRLRYFIAVCEHGGFSRASNSIGIAQPSLTRQIKLLEKEVGLALIHRTGRGAEPTEEGRLLLDGSRRHIDDLDDLVRKIRHRSSTLSGQIVLGICPTIAPFFRDDLKTHVRNTHPNVTLTVVEAYSGDLQSLMGRNRLDLSLTYRPSVPKGVDFIELFSEKLVLVTAYAPSQDGRSRSLADISQMKLILPSAIHELRRIIDRVCGDWGIRLQPDLELDSLDAVKSIIVGKSTQYATILPYYSMEPEISTNQLSCFDIDGGEMQRTIAVVTPKSGRNAHISAFLVDYICQQSSEIKARLGTLL